MDDMLTGADTTLALRRQLNDLCLAGGFPLRKWSSNDPALLDVPTERMQKEIREWRPHEIHATLGLQWHPATDSFSFTMRNLSMAQITKRSALSLTSRLFDPVGSLAPTIVRAKIYLQQIWLQGLRWDNLLNEVLAKKWRSYQMELPLLEQVRVPRWIGQYTPNNELEVHGFADASENAYAAVVYLRCKQGPFWKITLLAAKNEGRPN